MINGNLDRRQKSFQITAEHAKEGKENSHKVVMKLIEENVDHLYMQDEILFISPDQFDDVALERALSGRCGYPLCHRSLNLNLFGNQDYIIRHNRVYNIKERRNFCGEKCYEAFVVVREQVPITPLYLRSSDNELKLAKIYIPKLADLKGKYGRLVNITGLSGHCGNGEGEFHPSEKEKSETAKTSVQNVPSDNGGGDLPPSIDETAPCEDDTSALSEEMQRMSFCGIEKTSTGDSGSETLRDIYEVEMYLREWMSLDTLVLILGELYVKGMLEEIQGPQNNRGLLDLGPKGRAKYVALCERLRWGEELREPRRDSGDREGSSSQQLPQCERLKTEAEEEAQRVRCFYEGKECTKEPPEKGLDTIMEELDGELNPGRIQRKSKNQEKEITLPLVDSCSQNAWRRQIVTEKLKHSLYGHLRRLSLSEPEVIDLLHPIVASFDLTARNIVFRLRQWRFVSLILIKMLSIRYSEVGCAFTSEEGRVYIKSILESLELDDYYLDRVISFLTEINYVLYKNDLPIETATAKTKLTVDEDFKSTESNELD